jgi:hypothetical protein
VKFNKTGGIKNGNYAAMSEHFTLLINASVWQKRKPPREVIRKMTAFNFDIITHTC